MTMFIVLFILIALLGGTVIAFVRHAIDEGKDEPGYYTPSEKLKNAKIEIDDNRDEIEKIDKQIEEVKNDKVENYTDDALLSRIKNTARRN